MKVKMLIIDDEPESRSAMRRTLQEAGHDVIEDSDGNGAAYWVQWERPALVLLGIHMPRLDGIKALREIMSIDPTVSVIMVAGESDKEQAELAMSLGACDYILKPIDPRMLRACVMGQLAGHKPTQNRERQP